MIRVGKVALGPFSAVILIAAAQAQDAPSEPPFKSVPCNMNCLDTGHILAAPPTTDPAEDQGRHRVVVLTDMAADNDDSQSLVRLLLYSNEVDIEGLIATTSTFMMDRTNRWLIDGTLKAYSQVEAKSHKARSAVSGCRVPFLHHQNRASGVRAWRSWSRKRFGRFSIAYRRAEEERSTPTLGIDLGGANTLAQAL